MKSTITNAADITILRLIADGTLKTGGGPVSIGATVIRASRGPVGKVVQVTADNWQSIFGKPMPKKDDGMEGLRHLADAARECTYVNAVRVVKADAKFPSLSLKLIDDKGAWVDTVSYSVGDVVTVTGDVKLINAVAIVQKGAWANETPYVLNDVVDVADGKVICIVAHTSAASPDTGPTEAVPGTNWAVYAEPTANASQWDAFAPFTAAVHDYGATLSLGNGLVFQVWPIDGDPSTNRKVELANVVTDKAAYDTAASYVPNDVVTVTGGRLICIVAHIASDADPTMAAPTVRWKVYNGQYDNRATINFYDVDDEGDEYLLETYQVGFGQDDKDDLGRSAFIETVLEQQSDRFRANFDEALAFSAIHESLVAGSVKATFTGGTNGGAPTTQEWKDAWDLFRNEVYSANLMFAAGNYDSDVLANCLDIADDRHVSFFFDINPALPPDQALTWLKGTGLEGRQGAVYHAPIEASDPYYGGKCVWGVSGEAVAACAKGDANFTGSTPGIHYAPAGSLRAKLTRTGVKPLFPNDVMNRDDYYDARVNPVVAGENGGAVIDDCLSLWYRQDYRRFIWVNRIANYIDHRFVEGASALKFEPDGLTLSGLEKVIRGILDELVTSGAIVKPRDPADGTNPYKYTITQQEIDLWLVDWSFCPTGAARRIAGQPRLIK